MKTIHKPIPFHKYEPSVPKKEKGKYHGLNQEYVELLLDINKGMHHGYHKSCQDKVRFTTKLVADSVVKKYQEYHPEPKHSYLCPYCGHWHIGTDRDPRDKYDYPLQVSWEIINQLQINPQIKDKLEKTLNQMRHWKEK